MTRTLVFDPTDGGRFLGQRLQIDWRLLHSGFVHRYAASEDMHETCRRLGRLGYLVHTLDTASCTTLTDLYTILGDGLSLPEHLTREKYPFDNVLENVAMYYYGADPTTTGTVVALDNYQTLLDTDSTTAREFLDAFARQATLAALVGHPMLCLITAAATDLGPLGARPLHTPEPPLRSTREPAT